jgi:hypothetical protein
MEIILESTPFVSDIVVVSPLTTPAILGADFLKRYGAKIDLGRGQLRFEVPGPLSLNLKEGNAEREGIGLVRLT